MNTLPFTNQDNPNAYNANVSNQNIALLLSHQSHPAKKRMECHDRDTKDDDPSARSVESIKRPLSWRQRPAGGTTVTNQFSGITFQGTNYAMVTGGAGTGSQNINGRFLTEISIGIQSGAIVLDGPVTAAGLNLRTVSGLTTFEAYLGVGLVESFSAPTNLVLSNNFFGFQGILFDEIRFSNPAFYLDNPQFVNATAVSEPLAVAFLGLGLAGLVFARRKR